MLSNVGVLYALGAFAVYQLVGFLVRIVPSLRPILFPTALDVITDELDERDTDYSGVLSPCTEAVFFMNNGPHNQLVPKFDFKAQPQFLKCRLLDRIVSGANATQNPLPSIADRTAMINSSNRRFRRADKSTEKLLIAAIYPILQTAIRSVDGALELVDSEDDTFLPGEPVHDVREYFQKPDLHLIHKGFWRQTKPSVGTMLFGKPSVNCLKDMMCLLEGKVVTLSATEIGVLMKYLHYWSHCRGVRDARAIVSGIVFNGSEFVYCEYNGLAFFNFLRCSWSDDGSRDLFTRLVVELPVRTRPSLAIDGLCSVFNVQIVSGSSFLGRGSEGTVFEVVERDTQRHVALKVYSGNNHVTRAQNVLNLYQQLEAVPAIAGVIVGIRPGFPIRSVPDGSGFLLSAIGRPVIRSMFYSRAVGRQVLQLLRVLHVAGYYHGDARIANLVETDGTMKWIDLSNAAHIQSPNDIVRDLWALTNSIRTGHRRGGVRWPNEDVGQYQVVMNYANNPGDDTQFDAMEEAVSYKFRCL